jgi:hypothetical protein
MVSAGDFRTYMRQLAGGVWNEQGAAHSYGLSLQEETITEVLLLEMARTLSPLGLNVRMFSKQQEGGRTHTTKSIAPNGQVIEIEEVIIEAEGADWEWFFEGLDGCSASFRVQAKKLYHDVPTKDGRYGGFKPRGKQIDDLINRAKGSNPVYILYNHKEVSNNALFGPTRQPDYFGRSCWGCAVTTAQFMKHVSNDKLATIKPGCVPWHRFFSIGRQCRPAEAMKEIAGLLDLKDDEVPQKFVPATDRPIWVENLINGEVDLTGYLIEHQLKGVAYLDFSDLRG